VNEKSLVKISKYLSKHLRHQPERLGLKLETGGWTNVEDLLTACRRNNFPISREELEEVVEKNDKQRFSFDESKTKIRANQGHSIKIDLQLLPAAPPQILYHGTNEKSVSAILKHGILKMARHHVHLSVDAKTARAVGNRRGKPVIFVVDAAAMQKEGFEFFVSANGVWLVESVPPEFLRIYES
jgi:putative RNA 2'-phosphotransferase